MTARFACPRTRRGPALIAGVAAALVCGGLFQGARAADPVQPFSDADERAGYGAGYAVGRHLARLERQGARIGLEAVLQGVLDGLSDAEPRLSDTELREALEMRGPPGEGAGEATVEAGEPAPARTRGYKDDFAALNAKRPGVTTLPSGVQYEVLTPGDGPRPGANDRVALSYEGRLTTGAVFDSTYDDAEPARLRVADIAVPGLREALLLMKQGEKWRVVIPPRMGFGAVGNNMLRKRDLIYEIELVSVEAPGEGSAFEAAAPAPAGRGGPKAAPARSE